MSYRPDIDGLRAVAVLSVVIFHFLPDGLPGGFIGVDIFFVISGYLISGILFQDFDKNRFSLSHFYLRRVRRIFPALLLMLFATFIAGWLLCFPDEFKEIGKHFVGASLFASNIVYWSEQGYFNHSAYLKPLLHLWSLGVEEQFYLIWPPVLMFAWKRWNLRAVIWMGIGLSFASGLFSFYFEPSGAFYLPHNRVWEILVGALVAWGAFNKKPSMEVTKAQNAGSIFGVLLIIAGFISIRDSAFPGWNALIPVVGTALMLWAGERAWPNRLISGKVFVAVGLISYPLYLWHWPLMSFARMISDTPNLPPGENWILFGASVLLAIATYLFVEKPIRGVKNGPRLMWILLSLLVVCGILGGIGLATNGYEGRYSHVRPEIKKQFEWELTWNSDPGCAAKYGSEQFCQIMDLHSEPTAALIGDSHANHLYPGLAEYYRLKGSGNLLNVALGACPPLFDVDLGTQSGYGDLGCVKTMKPIYDAILNNKNIDTVYLAFQNDRYFDHDLPILDRKGEFVGDDQYEKFRGTLTRTVRALEAQGKKVVLMYDVPLLRVDIRTCFYPRLFLNPTLEACDFTKSPFAPDVEKYDRMLAEVKEATSLVVFDVHPYLKGNFPVGPNGIPKYRDVNHLSLEGSMFFADKYLEFFKTP